MEEEGKIFLKAAENGDLMQLKEILNNNPSIIHYKDEDGYTALHRASYSGHKDVVKELLVRGASTKAHTKDGWQPLHSACRWNNVECAALLLHAGADVNALSFGNQTPLHVAAYYGTADKCLALLLDWPFTDFEVKNGSGETAKQVAQRSHSGDNLFVITDSELNII